ncbi:hypothetical protein I5907_11950 [Panacibacter sp. DH6]|uniref:Uncharacterized protein n=1 Tax=Panacibacter microcysteis TaxID=2793269 RepID=A0A931GXZ1_9BACT|nr:hypothetical protein [Panacibacter microcysteis]MBG9376949.1 hypothetical protein [Panacibacter microcysteis]
MANTNNSNNTADLQDSERDQELLQPEETTMDLPEVKDIPGQENIKVPKMREMMDTTASSADEEGEGILDDEEDLEDGDLDEETDEDFDEDADVTDEEKDLLTRSNESMAGEEDEAVRNAMVDDTDDDGEKLNEEVDVSGSDLDVPGAELDDEDEEIGEEDEENNSYSRGQ